jgi:hypothetical protein
MGKAFDLPENLGRDRFRHPVCQRPGEEPRAEGLHPRAAALARHGAAQRIPLTQAEARQRLRYLEDLLLEQDDARRVVEHGCEERVGIGDRLRARPPPEIRMDHAALQWTWPNDRDLHHQVRKGPGAMPGEELLLGTRFDLKTANGIGRAQAVVGCGVIEGKQSRSRKTPSCWRTSRTVSWIISRAWSDKRSSLIKPAHSRLSLAHCTTTRLAMAARSSGTISPRGGPVMMRPPLL